MRISTILVGLTMTLLLFALPAAASDYTLDIFGNANEDNTINMQDVTYTELIILEYKEETQLADAKYDDEIDILDVTQIELIILGREREITLIDSIDRTVTVEKPVERVVVAYHPTAAVIKALGAEDKVVGVGSTITKAELLFPELSLLPSVGETHSGSIIDIEKIISLKPDLVIWIVGVTGGYITPEEIEQLESVGIQVVGCIGTDPATYRGEVEKLGYIFDKRTEAEEYIDWLDSYLDMIKDRTEGLSEEDRTRVFVTSGAYGEGQFYTYGEDDMSDNVMVEMAGGASISSDLSGGWISVDAEFVLMQNPSIIILESWYPTTSYDVDDISGAKALREEFMSKPAIMHTDAAKDGKVYLVDGSSIVWRGWFLGVPYFAKWFHPELFEDMDPNAIHQEWLTQFQRLDYDLDEHGVFVYHPQKHPDGK